MQIEDIEKCLKSHMEDLLILFFKKNYHKYLSKQKVFIFIFLEVIQNHVSQD